MTKNINIPIRTCIGCQRKRPKKEMIRIIRTPDGNYEIDTTGKKSGRGAYLCSNINCLNIAENKKRLNKTFNEDVPIKIINKLKEFIKNNNS